MRSAVLSAAFIGAALAAEPCAQVAAAVAKSGGTVNADLALQCLKSVPVDKEGDLLQLTGILGWINFHSDLAFLKNPPPGYAYPAVDVIGELQSIQSKLQNDEYDNEYDVQNDLLVLTNQVHDGHLVYTPDITQVFMWNRDGSLLSISTDGVSVPQTYFGSDLQVLAGQYKADYKPSPVVKINGQDAEAFLQTLANETSINSHDPDAAYNGLFPNYPASLIPTGSTPFILFSQQYQYQGTTTTISFANGTTIHIDTYASTSGDFSGVEDGASFFNTFCRGNFPEASYSASPSSAPASSSPSGTASASPARTTSASPSSSASASATPSSTKAAHRRAVTSSSAAASVTASSSVVSGSASTTAASGSSHPLPDNTVQVSYSAVPSQTAISYANYPQPWIAAGNNMISCYFPSIISDLTVIALPSFDPKEEFVEYQDVLRQCLATAEKKGKTKLIVDLRGNGGGDVIASYDFFTQLFPSIRPWGSSNFAAWPLFENLTQLISSEYSDVKDPKYPAYDNSDYASIFNYDIELNATLQEFPDWQAFYGPVSVNGGNYTNLVRYNLSNEYALSGHWISGYGPLKGIDPRQTFQASDILLLQDGQCASTCATFSEFMKDQGNVGSVVMGGRAQTGPMQAVGGTKGANEYGWDVFLNYAQSYLADAPASTKESFNEQWGEVMEGVSHALNRSTGQLGHLNFRNNIRQGDETLTPLQFVYEAADCRLFYTAEQYLEQELVWKAAYNSYWKGASCVSGSTGQDSSKAGDGYILGSPGATAVPTTPSSALPSSTSNPAVPMRTAAALAAMVPAFAVGAMMI